MRNRVASIVVTYNRLHLLQECLYSLRNQTYEQMQIIVVNNGSTDGTSEWLKTQTDLFVIEQGNLGGAGGFFTGLKYACEHGYEYSWIMDDDVVVENNALEKLMQATQTGVDGFLCSRVLDISGEQCNVPKVSTAKSVKTGELLWGERLNKRLLRVDITSFVSVLFKNATIFKVGLPYREYFIWGDDTEFTGRISRQFPSYMVIDSIVIHKRKNQGVLSLFTENDRNRMRNYFYLYRNSIHCQHTMARKSLLFLYNFYQLLRLILCGKFYAAYIICKGLISAITFHPKIQYPQSNA